MTVCVAQFEPGQLKAQLDADGYIVVPGLIPPALFPPLLEASERAITKTRSGEWPHRRIVGKQFPPFEGDETDVWGVQHLMHPDLDEPVFAKWYASESVRNVCKELFDCSDDDLQMELFNLLINPSRTPFALRWHRDDVPPHIIGDEVLERLSIASHGVQWNTALLPDSSLFIVPRTHRTALTEIQRSQCTPHAPADPYDMPGCLKVDLQPGDTIFYNNNILHCATYSDKIPRITLHACMGDARGGAKRARNILQHDLRWMASERMRDILKGLDGEDSDGVRVRERMLRRLLDLGAGTSDPGAHGFSLDG